MPPAVFSDNAFCQFMTLVTLVPSGQVLAHTQNGEEPMPAETEELVRVEYRDNVAMITLNRPEQRNAFVPHMARRFVEICSEVDAREEIGAVVIRGEGGAFCAGADRKVLQQAGTDPLEEQNFRDLGSVYEAFMRLGAMKAPVIAAVRGAAVGAGLNLALAADLRIVSEDARLIAGFLGIGIHPGGGHFSLMQRLLGREAVAAMVLFNEEVKGERAAEIGLAWEALPDEQVESRALQLAERAAADPSLARLATSSFRRMTAAAVDWEVAMAAERSAQMWSLRRREQRSHVSATDTSP